MKDLTVLKIVLWLLVLVSFPVSIWMNAELLGGNPLPFYGLIASIGLLFFIFGLKSRSWLVLPFCLGMQGNLNFLPIRFSMLELATLGCLGSTIFYYVMGDRRKLVLGPLLQRIPIFIICGIATFHWVKSGNIGLRTFGSAEIGARPIFTILMAGLSYFLILYLGSGDRTILRLVPWLYLGGTSIDFICQTLTYIMPTLATSIYRIYSNVNTEAFFYMMGADMQGGIVRLGAVNQFAIALAMALISQFPPISWLRPSGIWIPVALVGCLLGSLFGGFRSGVMTLALHVTAACYATMRSLVFIVVFMGMIFCLSLAGLQGGLLDLPLPMQRGLSFLPGKWDSRVVSSVEGSNDFRTKILNLYWKNYAVENMLVGSGWVVPKAVVEESELSFWQKIPDSDPDAEIRRFIELRNEHWGWVNAHHTTGLPGLLSVAVLILGSFGFALRRLYVTPRSFISPVMVWSFALISYQAVVFLFMGSPLRDCLPIICTVLGILNLAFDPWHVQRIHQPRSLGATLSPNTFPVAPEPGPAVT